MQGILPAIVTPFHEDGEFNPLVFEQLIERFYKAGIDGLYVCGQTGEGLQQPIEQRKRVAEMAVRCSPAGKHVIVHIGGHTTTDAVDLARHASRIGAAAVSSLPPAGGYSFLEIREYYRAVAAASDVPLLVYYFPSIAPNCTLLSQILELCELPNVAGLKFTDSDMYKVWSLRRKGKIVFHGSDEMLVSGLIMGANGGIGGTYNVMPELFVQLYRHAQAGEWQKARELQDIINPVIAEILNYPIHDAIKQILRAQGYDAGRAILPRRRLGEDEWLNLLNHLPLEMRVY